MSENYYGPDFGNYCGESPGLQSEETKPKTATKTKSLKILLCVLITVLLINGFSYLVIIPSTADCSVTFSGLQALEAKELGHTLALYCGTDWLGFDTAVAASHIAANSFVESVSVEKRFPDQVFIDIKERVPTAISLATVNDKTIPVLIDKNGVLFGFGSDTTSSLLPLITGLEFDTLVEGMRLDSRFYTLIQQISDIQKAKPEYFSAISEIRVFEKGYDNYELALYPIHSKVRVLTDRNLDEELLQHMMVVLDVIDSVNPDVSEVDLRYGSVSYKIN